MTIYKGYIVENIGFEALEAPPKRENQMKYMKVLFIYKIKCVARSRVRSIAGSAIDRKPTSVWSYDVCLVVALC